MEIRAPSVPEGRVLLVLSLQTVSRQSYHIKKDFSSDRLFGVHQLDRPDAVQKYDLRTNCGLLGLHGTSVILGQEFSCITLDFLEHHLRFPYYTLVYSNLF